MNIEEFAIRYLLKNGMSKEDAQTIIDIARVDETLLKRIRCDWTDTVEAMEQQQSFAKNILIVTLNEIVTHYLDGNTVKKSYRPIFAKSVYKCTCKDGKKCLVHI